MRPKESGSQPSGGGRPAPGARRSAGATAGWAIAVAAVALLAASAVASALDATGTTYLPVILRQTPTPTLSVTALPGACVPAGQVVRFRDWLADMPLEARSLECFRLSGLTDATGKRLSPSGVFIAVAAEVRNHGVQPGEVGLTGAFSVQASGGVRFDMAPAAVQDAVAYTFGRPGIYTQIPAGVAIVQIFAFDVPTGAVGLSLVSEFPW